MHLRRAARLRIVAFLIGIVLLAAGCTPARASIVMGYIGDSLLEGQTESAVFADLTPLGFTSMTLKLNGLGGRSITGGAPPYVPSSQDVVNTWRNDDDFHPTVWVIALISNNFGQTKDEIKAQINTLLDLLDDEPLTRVLWIGPVVRPGSPLQPKIDTAMLPALMEIAAERAGTAVDFRWLDLQASFRGLGVDEESPRLWYDDRHMTAGGYTYRTRFIHDFLAANLPGS